MPIPTYLSVLFILVTFLTIGLFLAAISNPKEGLRLRVFLIILIWAAMHSFIAWMGFYGENPDAVPPRLALVLIPTLIFFLVLFFSHWGREFLNILDLRALTMISIVRIPVEIGLYGLFVAGAVPELMTFAGRNFDILAGITAPFVAVFCFGGGNVKSGIVRWWNIISLLLLIFIIGNAVLSAPSPFQQFGFEQPNVALFQFPVILLPAIIVPLVLLSHIASLRLLKKENEN